MFSSGEILDLAVQIEQNGEAVYRDAIEKVSNPELISLLHWMADEEAKHAKWFMDLKAQVETHGANPFVEEMSRELFNELLGDKSFSHKEADFSRLTDVEELIAIFIEFEKDTILFYEILQPFIDDDQTLADLKKIITEENDHIRRLQELIGSEIAL